MLSLAFLNQSATADLELYITNNLQNWISDWCLLQPHPTVAIVSCQETDFDSFSKIYSLKNNNRLFFAAEDKNVNWKKLIFSEISTEALESTVVKKILKTAVDDLFTNFFGQYEASDATSLRFPKNIKTYLKITISFADVGVLHLICPHGIWDSLARKVDYKGLNKKIKREHLISSSVTKLSLSLYGGSIFIGNLKSVTVGAVIKLQSAPENKFSLSIGSKKIANAALGKIDTHKAFITLKE